MLEVGHGKEHILLWPEEVLVDSSHFVFKKLATHKNKSYNIFDEDRKPPETGMAHFDPAYSGGAQRAPGKVWVPRT